MAEWRYFINKTAQSNKYWKCKFVDNGRSVEKKWGRIGGHEDTQTKTFSSSYAAQDYVDGEISKKLAKGYIESDAEKLEHETDVAQTIGTRWKVDRMEFLAAFGAGGQNITVDITDQYNPDYGVYVEMLESWTKERRYLIIGKDMAWEAYAGGVSGGKARLNTPYEGSSFVAGIRKLLKQLSAAVEEVVVQFANIGSRMLSLGNDDNIETGQSQSAKALRAIAASTGVSNQVVVKFASLGQRCLEI